MKRIHLSDVIFILISCILFVIINYLGYTEKLSGYSYLILVIGYFMGRLVSGSLEKAAE